VIIVDFVDNIDWKQWHTSTNMLQETSLQACVAVRRFPGEKLVVRARQPPPPYCRWWLLAKLTPNKTANRGVIALDVFSNFFFCCCFFSLGGGAESLYSRYLGNAVKRYIRRFLFPSHFGLGGWWVWVVSFGFWAPSVRMISWGLDRD